MGGDVIESRSGVEKGSMLGADGRFLSTPVSILLWVDAFKEAENVSKNGFVIKNTASRRDFEVMRKRTLHRDEREKHGSGAEKTQVALHSVLFK